MERTYIAFFADEDGWGFFKFCSTHKAESKANYKDAETESIKRYGKAMNIFSTCLDKKK